MNEIKFNPIGRVYLTPSQKKDKAIKNLTFWVVVLGAADIIYTSIAIMMLINGVLK